MLKCLAILAAWLSCAWIMAGQADKNSRPNPQPTKQEQPTLHTANGEQSQAIPTDNKDKPDNASKGRNTSFEWPKWTGDSNWWLVIIAGLTGGVIGWQSWETRKAAEATKEAANAAYGSLSFAEAQMELMMEEKRARLDLNVERTNLEVEVAGGDLVHLIATVSVRNIGESKAFIGRTSGTLITKLRNEPREDSDYSPLDFPEQFIEPDKPPIAVKVYCFPTITTATFAECLEGGTSTLHFFGFIEYETLGLWRRKEFGYDWKILDRNSGLAGLYGLSDPYPNSPRPARDRITYGYWSANEEKEKPEYRISSEPDGEQNPN
jgi:hypothetical protein